MNKEFLINVFTDTENIVNNGAYDNVLFSTKKIIDSYFIEIIDAQKEGLITIENEDCVTIAQRLSYTGKTCILNMASHYKPGGGVRGGARAQEEELCRRSNLIFALEHNNNSNLYPIKEDELIYSSNITFFKDSRYKVCEPFNLDVITIPAINLNKEKHKDYFDIEGKEELYKILMNNKILATIKEPYKNGCDNLVLSAFGCGVFKNDPEFVANTYKEFLIKNNLRYLYKRISFAILNDSNSVKNNFQIFKSILNG